MFFSQATVNCQNIGNMPEVTFTLNGNAFTIPASAYVSQVSQNPCHPLQQKVFNTIMKIWGSKCIFRCLSIDLLRLQHWLWPGWLWPALDPGRCLHQGVLCHLWFPESANWSGHICVVKWHTRWIIYKCFHCRGLFDLKQKRVQMETVEIHGNILYLPLH